MRVLHSKRLIFIAKPRCGSTRLRGVLNEYLRPNDLAVDLGCKSSLLHPHITGPALRNILEDFYNVNTSNYCYFTVVRHPIEMLRSYYKFFQPDSTSRYFFDQHWTGEIGMSFNDWIINGKVGMRAFWQKFAPAHISLDDLSALSLEAHFCGPDNQVISPNIFRLENLAELSGWLADNFNITFDDVHKKVNRSQAAIQTSALSAEALDKVRAMFPKECDIYNV